MADHFHRYPIRNIESVSSPWQDMRTEHADSFTVLFKAITLVCARTNRDVIHCIEAYAITLVVPFREHTRYVLSGILYGLHVQETLQLPDADEAIKTFEDDLASYLLLMRTRK